MQTGIDHEAHGAEHLGLQTAEVVERVRLEAHLPGEALGVERPALREGGEGQHLAEHRHAGEFLLDRGLEGVPGDRLVIGQRAHAKARDFRRVARVDGEDAGTGAVEGGWVVVGAGRGLFAEHGHALDLHPRLRSPIEGVTQAGVDLVDDGLEVGDDLRATFVAVRVELVRTPGDLWHALADAALGEVLGIEDRVGPPLSTA